MGRNDHFDHGSMEHHDPRSMHPNMNEYRDGGMGGEGDNHSVIGYVRTDRLAQMHGNATDREGIDRHKAALTSGRGFTDPIMVEFDPVKRKAVVGEGNHRVEAARELGISHVPTRVVRSRIRDDEEDYMRRNGGQAATVDVGTSPWKGGRGEEYWPSDLHPRHIFPKDTM